MSLFRNLVQRRQLLIAAVLIGVLVLLLASGPAVNAHPPAQAAVPHSIADHQDCVSCHATGVGDAKQFPADHQGRTNSTCTNCHLPAASNTTTTTPTTGSTETGPLSVEQWSSTQCQACHPKEWNDWLTSGHKMTLADQLLNAEHNSSEPLEQTCLKCHSPELGKEKIENIVQPISTTGPWTLVGQYANLGDAHAITCLACHQTHSPMTGSPAAAGSKPVTNIAIYDAFAQQHVAPRPIAPVMNGDQAIPVADTLANRLCYTCHGTEQAESNLFEPDKAPEGDNSVGSGDDRTLMGAHQGMQCVACHMAGGSHTFDPRQSCQQCHAQGATPASLEFVQQVQTSYTDSTLSMSSGAMSSLNVHFLDPSQLWPPVSVGMTAEDQGDTVAYHITIHSLAAWDMSNVVVRGSIPSGSGYLDSWVLNRNNPGKFTGTDVELNVGHISAGETVGPIVYRVLKGTAKDLTARAWVVWEQPMTGSANSPSATISK
ncbi:MAG: multiheme c-type cytochrome [Anaerolineae bacterium]